MGLLKKNAPDTAGERKGGKLIRLCPRCKKPMSRPASNVSGWFAPDEFTCNNCGYMGHFFIEVDPSEVDLQKLEEITSGKRQLDEIEPDEGEAKVELEEEESELTMRKQRFMKILKVYSEISLAKMAQLLEFENAIELESWLLDQPGDFPFKISGNMVKIQSTDLAADINRLDAAFEDWKKNEKSGNGKGN